jgi:hypothetical protein
MENLKDGLAAMLAVFDAAPKGVQKEWLFVVPATAEPDVHEWLRKRGIVYGRLPR